MLCRRITADCDVGQLWPHVSAAATGIVKEQLDPQLAQNKPKWISDIYLHRFNLGDEPPSISGVKVDSFCILADPLMFYVLHGQE